MANANPFWRPDKRTRSAINRGASKMAYKPIAKPVVCNRCAAEIRFENRVPYDWGTTRRHRC
jgi:hypothetical protein